MKAIKSWWNDHPKLGAGLATAICFLLVVGVLQGHLICAPGAVITIVCMAFLWGAR